MKRNSSLSNLEQRILNLLPNCPGLYRSEIRERLVAHPPPPGLERAAIEEMARAVIRHQLTDYDRLIAEHGLTREEARLSVEEEVEDWVSQWRQERKKVLQQTVVI